MSKTSQRIESFDLLRGLSALGVAIPHMFLLFQNSIVWESVSIISVEIFFALSGFVLAPQLIYLHKHASNYNLWVFYLRRWIRTISPYLIALTLIGLLTGSLFSWQFLAKASFLDSLVRVPSDDFFAISWSLAVEEWYYIGAALLVFIFRKTPLSKLFTTVVIGLFLIKIAGFFLDEEWVISVRRATIYRLDAITFGFLMYIWRQYLPKYIWQALVFAIVSLVTVLILLNGFKQDFGGVGTALLLLAIYGLSAFSLSMVLVFQLSNSLINRWKLSKLANFLGIISYPVYLFHLPIGYAFFALKLPFWTTLILAIGTTVFFAWLFHELVESYFIKQRPIYQEKLQQPAKRSSGEANQLQQTTLTPGSVLTRVGSLLIACTLIVFTMEIASQSYLNFKQPSLSHSLLYSDRDMNKPGTKHIFGAIDPQLGYAHPRRFTMETKSFSVSAITGYGVHRPKEGEFLKIFVLGGSTSDPFLAISKNIKPWTAYLYLECREVRNCGVWNAGVGGFGSPQELIKLVRDIVPEQPDLVISLHGPNELNRYQRAPFMTGVLYEQARSTAAEGKLWFGGWFPNILTTLGLVRNDDDIPSEQREIYTGFRYQQTPFERWKNNVIMMSAISDSQGFKYFTILQPLVGFGNYAAHESILSRANRPNSYYQSVNEFYEQATTFCKTVDFCIDVSGAFDGMEENLFRDIRHPNDAGNQVMSSAIAAKLNSLGLFE